MNQDETPESPTAAIALLGVVPALGLAIGVGVGVAVDRIAVGIGLGLSGSALLTLLLVALLKPSGSSSE